MGSLVLGGDFTRVGPHGDVREVPPAVVRFGAYVADSSRAGGCDGGVDGGGRCSNARPPIVIGTVLLQVVGG